MSPTSEQAAIGRRMKAAAVQAQLGAYEIARRLGVKAATVYRWWYGERTPSSEMMLAYARLVGRPVGSFYGEAANEEEPRELAQMLLGWAGLLMAGEAPGTAFDRVTGEPAELTPRERQKLAAAAPRMRDDLTRAAGGDWALLTEAQRHQILRQIAQMAEERRSGPAESP